MGIAGGSEEDWRARRLASLVGKTVAGAAAGRALEGVLGAGGTDRENTLFAAYTIYTHIMLY